MVDISAQQIQNKVPPASHQTTLSAMARWTAIGGLFVTLVIGYAWIRNEMLDIGYQVEQIARENTILSKNIAALDAEYNSIVNPAKIDKVAREMGLIDSNAAGVTILEAEAGAEAAADLLAATRDFPPVE